MVPEVPTVSPSCRDTVTLMSTEEVESPPAARMLTAAGVLVCGAVAAARNVSQTDPSFPSATVSWFGDQEAVTPVGSQPALNVSATVDGGGDGLVLPLPPLVPLLPPGGDRSPPNHQSHVCGTARPERQGIFVRIQRYIDLHVISLLLFLGSMPCAQSVTILRAFNSCCTTTGALQ